MTRLALLADLHFGSVPHGLEELLLDDLLAAAPDAVIIAGDLTMAATEAEFAAARAWLDRLPLKRIIVPGNHDIPKFNLIQRFLRPFQRFEETIGADERDPLVLGQCHVVGLNTVAPWQPHLRWQEGRVRRRSVAKFSRSISETPPDKFRVAVAHHPFAKVPDMTRARPVRRAASMLDAFHANEVDLVLSGHTHQSYVLPIADSRNHLIAVGAPTALSSRRRGEENGYWLIDLSEGRITLTRRLRERAGFIACEPHSYGAADYAVRLDAPSEIGNRFSVQKCDKTKS
jgi:3',5'-cyclic AMP phosphodiesterase CpdA